MSVNIPAINSIITDYLSDDTNKTEVNGLVEDTLASIFKECFTTQQLKLEAYLKEFDSDPDGIIDETVNQVFKDLMNSPPIKDFYVTLRENRDEANLPRIIINFMDLDHPGNCHPEEGDIFIDKKLDKYVKRSVMIFELVNVSLYIEFNKIDEDTGNGTIKDRVEYARRIELIEFEATKNHNRLIRESIEHGSMDKSMEKMLFDEEMTFEEYFELVKDNHALFFMEKFDGIQNGTLELKKK